MRVIDWVGLGLIVVLGAGGAIYYVKSRPLAPQQQAGNGVPVPVYADGQNFVAPHTAQPPKDQGPSDPGVRDAGYLISTIGGTIGNLFGAAGSSGLFN